MTDCGKAADDFLTGNYFAKSEPDIWSWLHFSELRNCSIKNVDFDRCQCIAAIDASNFAFLKVKQFIWSKSLYSQMQECSLNAYREDALSRKTKCKKAVGNCKNAAVRFLSRLSFLWWIFTRRCSSLTKNVFSSSTLQVMRPPFLPLQRWSLRNLDNFWNFLCNFCWSLQ